MDLPRRLIGRVQKISSFFGVCFAHSVYRRRNLLSIVIVQIYFISFSTFLTFSSLAGVSHPFLFVLVTIQVILPVFIEMTINIEAYKKHNLDVKIEKKFKQLDDILENELKVEAISEAASCFSSFMLKLCLLIVVRILKIFFAGVLFSMNVMFCELVSSVCDYAFSFYVQLLRVYVRAYSRNMSTSNSSKLEVRKHLLVFYKIARLLKRRYAISLLLNISYSFISLITCLYWFFIRIIYGPLKCDDHHTRFVSRTLKPSNLSDTQLFFIAFSQ